MPTKAFAYLRVSGRGQIDGDGFPRQLSAVKAYAAAHDLKIVRVYREEGVSGTLDADARPAWSALMEALYANGTRTVIVERLDRLARDLMVQETVIADLRKRGFELVSVAEPDLMANDPTRILMRQLMGAVAQYDKSQIVLKLRAARDRVRKAAGRCEGRKPYGHRAGEAVVVERIKAARAAGKSYSAIAADLNADGVAPRQGSQWWAYTVSKILEHT